MLVANNCLLAPVCSISSLVQRQRVRSNMYKPINAALLTLKFILMFYRYACLDPYIKWYLQKIDKTFIHHVYKL